MSKIYDYDPVAGDLCQGDVLLFRLPDGYIPSTGQPIAPEGGKLILARGEMTGHHHAIWFNPPQFRDDAMARALETPAKSVETAIATLYRDDALTQRLVAGGHLVTAELAIGYLVVKGEASVLRHQEHDAIRIPAGAYYVGRQQEFHAGESRMVAD